MSNEAKEFGEYGKCVRVELRFEDGTVRSVSGDAAQEYVEHIAHLSVFGWAHGEEGPDLPWEETKTN